MADQKIPYEYQTDFGQIGELEKIAELMEKQRLLNRQQMQGQMVSGHFIRMSPMQGLADMFAAYQGGKARREAARLRAELPQRMAKAEQGTIDKMAELLVGKPSRQEPTPEWGFGPGDAKQLPAVAADPMAAERMGFASQWPRAQEAAKRLADERQKNLTVGATGATNPSRVQAAQSGNPADLKPASPGQPQVIPGSDKRPDPNRPGSFLPPIFGYQDEKGNWHELGADRAAKVTVDARSFGPETDFFKTFQVERGKQAAQLAADAEAQKKNLEGLQRVKAILAEGPITAGPQLTARAEQGIRNFFSQYGLPLDRALDSRNARMTAEGASFLAAKIIAGGRAITDQDIQRIAKTWPGIESGIPYEALPAFIGQLEVIANSQIEAWETFRSGIPAADQAKLPSSIRRVTSPTPGVQPFPDAEKERRYQEWKRTQMMGGSPVRGGQ